MGMFLRIEKLFWISIISLAVVVASIAAAHAVRPANDQTNSNRSEQFRFGEKHLDPSQSGSGKIAAPSFGS